LFRITIVQQIIIDICFSICFVVSFSFFLIIVAPLPISRDVVAAEKAEKKRDGENNARPKPFKLPIVSCFALLPSYYPTTSVVSRLYHLPGNKEEKKRKKNTTKTLLIFFRSVFFFFLHSIRGFHFFSSSKKKEERKFPCIFSLYFSVFFQMILCHYNRRFSLVFSTLHLKRDKKINE